MAVFRSSVALPPIPDDLSVPQFLLDAQHPVRPLREHGVPWIIDDVSGRTIGYEELRTRSYGLANALSLVYHIQENDVVCLYSSNHVDYPLIVWAIHRLGGIVTPSNPAYNTEELVNQLSQTSAGLVIVHPDFLETALSAAEQVNLPTDRIILISALPASPYADITSLIAYGLSKERAFIEKKLAPGEGKTKLAFLCLSSGTTGKPKAVTIPHYAVIANVIQMAAFHRVNEPGLPAHLRRYIPGNVSTAMLPFFHIYGLVINIHFMLFAGMSIVVMPKFNFVEMLKSIVKYRITHLTIVPPMMILLCKHPAVKDYDLSHVRAAFSGAAPLSLEVIHQLAKILPNAQVGQGYGMTETVTAVSMAPIEQKVGSGSVGTLLPGVIAKVVKADGTLGGVGETGELVLTGPSMAIGYLNNEEATKSTFIDGWVRTGDEVMFNEAGELVIVDRLKELIKVRGFQVAPAELEGHLLDHPYVSDVCVIGIADDYSGEVPLAFVVLHADLRERANDPKQAKEIQDALYKHVADNKTKYKWLAGGVRFIDAIPKSPSGKILRRILRDEVNQENKNRTSFKAKL